MKYPVKSILNFIKMKRYLPENISENLLIQLSYSKQYLISIYYVPGNILRTRDTSLTDREKCQPYTA